ncbi:cilia- and flagella-associated protein 46 [Osmerus mordax]|uniref:cilia- and flagella-associated protein 46 n=1 Tax=Osmerus mordax TaxID=8014 RepID=UPI00351094AB
MDLPIRQYLTKAQQHKDVGALRSAYELIVKGTSEETASDTRCFGPPELYVLCAEQALQLGCNKISRECLRMYFEGKPPDNQFLCRAYLCQGQLNSPQTVGSVEEIEKAAIYFLKAIEISKDKPRYHFLVFNASVLYFQKVRPLMRPRLRQHLVPSLSQVVKALEEVGEPDHSWRAHLMQLLVECLVDAGKWKEACSFAKATSDFIESYAPDLYPQIFSLLVRHKLFDFSKSPKQTEASPMLSVIYKMQNLKHDVELSEAKNDYPAKLSEIFHLLVQSEPPPQPTVVPDTRPAQDENLLPISPTDRMSFLLELALLASQLKHQQMAADCLKELKTVGVQSVGQGIMIECVECELDLQKQGGKMKDYSKSSVEAQLKVVGRLDQLLQSAVRDGEAHVMQGVCATQWNACLPLLQHNLRRKIKPALLRLAEVLEDTHSLLLETRCQVHSELALIEEEEGRLDPALVHLQKALLLDEGGVHRERLCSAVHLLQLSGTLYQTPARTEDQAAMLIQQAKNGQPQEGVRRRRPMLVTAGLTLAPDAFQVVLDADNTGQGTEGPGRVAQLSARAQHHAACVGKLDGHVARQTDSSNHRERMKLWGALAKVARKQEVWDVCRAACRFCLLYDDGRWKMPKTEGEELNNNHARSNQSHLLGLVQSTERDLLRLLAEVCFINAEATIHKLRTEGVQLNSPAVPPDERGRGPSDDDPQWAVYKDWIQSLSAYATSNFLRAADLGAELREAWVVVNAAVYLWNYNSHLLAQGEHRRLLAPFQKLVELLKQTGHAGEPVLLVLLCDAVAQGMIQPWSGAGASQEVQDGGGRGAPPGDKAKKAAGKGAERSSSVHGVSLDPAALQDVRKALELCDYALHLSNCNIPGESILIAARKQVVSTWVRSKRLLQQQVGQKLDIDDECKNESVSAMTRVLVGVEMFLCNSHPRQMEFSVPSLSALVRMASDCKWSDPVVELQVWTQLASFSYHAHDHNLVRTCTHNALQLEEAAAQRLKVMPYALYKPSAVQEILSNAALLRGLSMAHKSSGHPHSYKAALRMLQSSVSYAEHAGNPALCVAAARHYWNACLPLTETPAERQHLREPLESILRALAPCSTKEPKGKGKHLTAGPSGSSSGSGTSEGDLTLIAAMYGLLFHIHADRADWKQAVQVLDEAIRDMPRTRARILLFKHRVLVRARLGESVLMDMQKFRDEGELSCSHMWHRVALCAQDVLQQLASYQNSITSLVSLPSQWQKVDYLLEFGEWLFCQSFPLADAQYQVQWAIDILLLVDPDQGGITEPAEGAGLIPVKCESHIGVQGVQACPCLSDLRDVRRLDGLVRAHTLLAVMADRTDPQHQQNLLRAYCCVLQIWQVSMATAVEVIKEMQKNLAGQPSQLPPSATSRKDKDKEKDKNKKTKDPPPLEEKPKPRPYSNALPCSPEEWARYDCSEELRQAFRYDSSPNSINTHSIRKQTQSIFFLDLLAKELHSLSLTHLTLPIMHLAEVIAHDLLDRQSLSDLYRLRIVKTCCESGMETCSPYREKLLSLAGLPEQEQMECRRALTLQAERNGLEGCKRDEPFVLDHGGVSGKQGADVWAPGVWVDKAEVCLSMGLYQPARQLLAEAQLVAKVLGDQAAVARAFYGLAVLASYEQNHSQALALLEKARELGGDEEFWYQVTLALVKSTVDLKAPDSAAKVDQIIKRGCGALKVVLGQRQNSAHYLRFLLTSLETRGARERVCGARPCEPGETLSSQSVQKLMAACDTLREAVGGFLQLGRREQAVEALLEHAQALRVLASHAVNVEGKQRHLLDAFSLLQQAVFVQEHVALNAQSLFPSQEVWQGRPLALPAMRVLVRVRLALARLSLTMLEQVCVEEKRLALAQDRKGSVQRTLEEFGRSTPDLNSLEQEWVTVGRTLAQVALCQLITVTSLSLDCVDSRAHSLGLMGKCLRLLAMQKDPLYPSSLWDGHNLEESRPGGQAPPALRDDELSEENVGESSGTEPRLYPAKCAELQGRRRAAQELLAQATETLGQAIALCLQHGLPTPILSQACLDMLECHGQFDPGATGQYMALLQSCSCVCLLADVVSSACSDTRVSRLSALLNLHRNLLITQEDIPRRLLGAAEDSLHSLSQVYSHLSVNPNHLSLLGELPSNMKILLLQHSEDRSVLYAAFYERSKHTESQKGKAMQGSAGTLVCSRVAKVSVHPGALLALRAKMKAFHHQTRHALLKEARWHGNHNRPGAVGERHTPPKCTSEDGLESLFREVVHEMEVYLHPALSQFEFSGLRHQTPSISIPESSKPKEKEEKAVGSPAELGECVVLLADGPLMELPLEALSGLQDEGLSSVSRDLSLQLLHSRLHRKEQPVESDNKKETKGGKGAKGKGDQSKAIKVVPVNRVLPPNTHPVDTHKIKYIIDPYDEGEFEGASLSERMKRTLEAHSQQFTPFWEGFMGGECTPSVAEVEQLLTSGSAFIFHGMERFLANIPPATLTALNLSECQMAVLFDLVQNSASMLRQSKLDVNKSERHMALEKPLETVLLLSLSGVRCVTLNQWHSSLQRNVCNMDAIMDNLLRVGLTSGQAVHSLRKGEVQSKDQDAKATPASNDAVSRVGSDSGRAESLDDPLHRKPPPLSAYNYIIYGLPNLVVT